MHTDTTHEKAHSCDPVGFQNDTINSIDVPTAASGGKAFTTLAARFALAGHTLTRSNPADGAVMYYAGRWGLSRALPNLEAAAQFLAVIGGVNV